MERVVRAFEAADFGRAAREMEPVLRDRSSSDMDRVLYELEAGAVFAASGDLARSSAAYARADELTWPYLDEKPEVRIAEQAAAILTNQTVVTYRGRPYDRICCAAFEAINRMAEGDLDGAGVMLRRAYEWQRDAVERNAAEIAGLEEEAASSAKANGYDLGAAERDARTWTRLDSAYGAIREMQGYADFAVPYATYLAGLQRIATGRNDAIAEAVVDFRRVAGMLGPKDGADAELEARLAEDATRGAALVPTVHVLCESGMGPWLDELRIDVPLFIRQLPYVGAAFPVLRFRAGGPDGFALRAGGEARRSAVLTDFDRVVAGDFNRRLPAIIALTIVSSATKATATYFAQEAFTSNDRGAAWAASIVGALYQVATNSADLRTWLTLPKRVHYARVAAPSDGTVLIELDGGARVGPIAVESDGLTIVHLRAPASGRPPAVRTMRFPFVTQSARGPTDDALAAPDGGRTGAATTPS